MARDKKRQGIKLKYELRIRVVNWASVYRVSQAQNDKTHWLRWGNSLSHSACFAL